MSTNRIRRTTWATCDYCGNEQAPGTPCLALAQVEGIWYHRVPFSSPSPSRGLRTTCRDCNVVEGQHHHRGCCVEKCPRCLGQAISCECRWEGDAAPDNEALEARRASPAEVQVFHLFRSAPVEHP
jgi:hypothetical protein